MTWEALEPVLQATGYEYARQGSYAEEGDLPSSFFTFWNLDTPLESFYDNSAGRRVWRWQVYFYTKDPGLLYTEMDSLMESAREHGFTPEGSAWDIDTNEPGYVGRTIRLAYAEIISNEEA